MGVSSVTIRQQTRWIGRRFPEQFQNIYNARFVKLSTKYFGNFIFKQICTALQFLRTILLFFYLASNERSQCCPTSNTSDGIIKSRQWWYVSYLVRSGPVQITYIKSPVVKGSSEKKKSLVATGSLGKGKCSSEMQNPDLFSSNKKNIPSKFPISMDNAKTIYNRVGRKISLS